MNDRVPGVLARITPPPQQETIGQFYDAISVALAQVAPHLFRATTRCGHDRRKLIDPGLKTCRRPECDKYDQGAGGGDVYLTR